MTIIATYGSLRKLGRSNHFLKDSEYLGEDYVFGHLYGTLAFFPGVRLLKDHEHYADVYKSSQMPFCDFMKLPRVKVELYRVSDETLKALDQYEGDTKNEESLFKATPSKTEVGVPVLIYEANFPLDEKLLVTEGDWFHTMG